VLGRQRSRIALLAMLGGYFGLLLGLGGHREWGKLGVGTAGIEFADLRNVTAAWDCTRKGMAVLPTNPCDPFGRPANYPRLWLLPDHLGLGQGDTLWLGFVVACIFFAAAVVVLPGRAGWGTTVIYAVALCSGATMLGVERGNVDLLLFALVALAVLVSRRGLRGLIAADVLIWLAAALKLFPIFAIGFLARRRTRAAVVSIAVVIASFALYALAIRHQLQEIRAAFPQGDKVSFGVRRVSDWLSAGIDGTRATRTSLIGWDVLLLVVMTGGAWLTARRLKPTAPALPGASAERDLDLFWAGACVYVGSYAVARNFDYRLVFCLLTVPQLCRWGKAGSKLAWVAIAALLGAMWLDGWYSWFIWSWLNQFASWTAVGPNAQPLPLAAIMQLVLWFAFASWLLATAPPLMRRESRRSRRTGEARRRTQTAAV
jgi:hypothetical protein